MALDQQETFNQLVRQNNAYRECLERLESWLTPGGASPENRLDMLAAVRSSLKTN